MFHYLCYVIVRFANQHRCLLEHDPFLLTAKFRIPEVVSLLVELA